MSRTLGARGEAKLNRTLGESPTDWRVRQQPLKKKHSLHFCFGRGEISFEKGKGVFFRGSTFKVFRQCGGAKCGRGKAKLFLREEKDLLCLDSFLYWIWHPPRRRVWGGIRDGFFSVFNVSLADLQTKKSLINSTIRKNV